MPVKERDYDPNTAQLERCLTCGMWCTPFPSRQSGQCSWCYFLWRVKQQQQRGEGET